MIDEIGFKIWCLKQKQNPKVVSDHISRLKKLEQALDYCDIDKEYHSNRCVNLLAVFYNKGINNAMNKYSNPKLPVGKYSLSTYKYSLNQYIKFLDTKFKKD